MKKILVLAALITGALLTYVGEHWNPADSVSNGPKSSSLTMPTLSQTLGVPNVMSLAPPASFSDLVKKVKPAVVNIATTKEVVQRSRNLGYWDSFPGRSPNQTKKQSNSLGSGVIISGEGNIVTNNHVIEGADEIIVTLEDGREIKAKVVGRDPRLDLAVLRLEKAGTYPFVTFGNSDALEIGEWVVAMGNPFGLGQTVTAGIVSAKARHLGAGPYDDFIQTDASINPGNSGGPLFNTNGELVGINTAILSTGQGLGFAIPVNAVKEVAPQLIATGKVVRGWLGVAIGEIDHEVARELGLSKPEGVLVAEAIPNGPAQNAGIAAGDIILEFNGAKVDNSYSFPSLVAKLSPGTQTKIVFLHQGKQYERTVTLGSLDDPQVAQASGQMENVLGLKIRNLNENEVRTLGIQGVLVTDVARGSAVEAIGVQKGDLIVDVNGTHIATTIQFKAATDRVPLGQVMRMGLARGPNIYYFAFRKE